ncbi:MAG: peptidoglycan DD-metalloendopeptidase family protein [Clostridium sp.]|nr:peptidoglycan DD-metalloendopeptidase family protein [Clostridium sp.]
MNFKFKGIKWGIIAVLSVAAIPVCGQDLIASQAPIDKKMRAVDSVALQRLINDEQLDNPSFSLYPEWSNKYVHRYNAELPEEFKIDLRHFCMPTTSRQITSNYGYRRQFRRMHKGLDIKVYIGDTIRAAFSGKVRVVAYEGKGYGKYVVIRHNNGLETVYGHMSAQLVRENDIVKAGEPIGLGGNTGRSTGSHLHFETRLLGEPIDPAEMFNFEAQDVTGDFYVFRAHADNTVLASHDGSGDKVIRSVASSASVKKAADNRSAQKRPRVGGNVHKVKSGETLSTIARKHGTSVAQLCKLNHIKTTTILRPGQILRCS